MELNYRIKYKDKSGNEFDDYFPTREEAEDAAELLFEDGFAVNPRIEEIRK